MKASKLLPTAALLAVSVPSFSAEVEVTVQNLTPGIYFTPILVAAHPQDASLFNVGETASSELQAMAEGGDTSGLATILEGINGDIGSQSVDDGLTSPAMSRMFSLSTMDENTHLSITAMMLPTNDGFVGLNSWEIPEEAGTYTIYLNAYDAGTEANDEIRGSGAPGEAGLPVPPPLETLIGMNGTGVTTAESNTMVHIHRGNLGDDSASAGISDISNQVQRWLNPVAKVTVVVQ